MIVKVIPTISRQIALIDFAILWLNSKNQNKNYAVNLKIYTQKIHSTEFILTTILKNNNPAITKEKICMMSIVIMSFVKWLLKSTNDSMSLIILIQSLFSLCCWVISSMNQLQVKILNNKEIKPNMVMDNTIKTRKKISKMMIIWRKIKITLTKRMTKSLRKNTLRNKIKAKKRKTSISKLFKGILTMKNKISQIIKQKKSMNTYKIRRHRETKTLFSNWSNNRLETL